MKLAYPWIRSKERQHWHYRYSSNPPNFRNEVCFVILVSVAEDLSESWEWATFLELSDEDSPPGTRGICSSEEAAMKECDDCLIKFGWKLVDDKYKVIL